MTEKREWYEVYDWDAKRQQWSYIRPASTLEQAQYMVRNCRLKTRIVKHTTEVVEEREPQAERKDGER